MCVFTHGLLKGDRIKVGFFGCFSSHFEIIEINDTHFTTSFQLVYRKEVGMLARKISWILPWKSCSDAIGYLNNVLSGSSILLKEKKKKQLQSRCQI